MRDEGEQEEQDLSIRRLLAVLWRGRWIIVTTSLLGGSLGWYHVRERGDIWRAQSEVYVESPQRLGGGLGDLLSTIGVDNLAHKQAHLLRSDLILERALDGDPEKQLPSLRTAGVFPSDVQPVAQVEWLRRNLKTAVGDDDEIITVSLDHAEQEPACRIVNAVVDTFASYVLEKRSDSAEDLLERYDGEVVQLRAEADKLRERAGELIAEHDLDPEGLVLKRLSEAIRRAETHLEETVEVIQQTEEAVRKLAEHPPQTPELLALASSVQRLETELALLLARFTERHPAVISLVAALDAARTQLAEQQAEATLRARGELDFALRTATSRRERLEQRLEIETERYKELNLHYLEFLELGERLELSRQMLEIRLVKIRELSAAKIGVEEQALGVEVRSRPVVGRLRNVAGRGLRLMLAVLIGAGLGAFLSWLRDSLDQRLRSPDEASTLLSLRTLGKLPHVQSVRGESEAAAFARWNQNRVFSEAARSLRTQVFFGLSADEGRILQVTSPDQGDGKSSVAAHFALAMAKAGKRTLLIDGDMRRPRVARLFGMQDDVPGFAELLQAEAAPETLPVVESGYENLELLLAGRATDRPAELLNSDRLVEVLQLLGEHFDRVVVDSPPVMPVADASILGPRCDRTILVLRADHSTRKRARSALNSLTGVGTKVLGLVFNDMPQQRGVYSRHYGDGGQGYYVDRYLTADERARGGGPQGAASTGKAAPAAEQSSRH